MRNTKVIEVGYGDSAQPPVLGRPKFQSGADWLFRHIREGGKVRMRYGVGGFPATSDFLVIALDDEDLEALGLIEDRLTEDNSPWDNDYAEGIIEFLLENRKSLRRFLAARGAQAASETTSPQTAPIESELIRPVPNSQEASGHDEIERARSEDAPTVGICDRNELLARLKRTPADRPEKILALVTVDPYRALISVSPPDGERTFTPVEVPAQVSGPGATWLTSLQELEQALRRVGRVHAALGDGRDGVLAITAVRPNEIDELLEAFAV